MELPLRWRVFEAVARRLSFSKAAEELFISQPAVTRHIKDLEQELGMTLFERNGNRGIDLTAQGHGFKAFMGNVNLLKQDLETSFHISGMQWEGDLAIGASSTVGLYVLPPLLAKFHQRFPGIKVQLLTGNTEDILHALQSNRIAVAIVEGMDRNPLFHYENFLKDEIIPVCSTQGKFAKAGILSVHKLKDYPLVMREYGSGTLEVIADYLKSKGVGMNELDIVIRLSNTESIKGYVEQGDALAFVSVHAVKQELAQGFLQVLKLKEGSMERIFRFVEKAGAQVPLANVFRKFLKKEVVQ